MPDVILTDLEKHYDGAAAPSVRETTLTLPEGEFICLLGPSGCGKTTTLRMIAGLETPTAGSIRYGDRVFSDAATGQFLPPEKRELGLMFQSYALWPHMTVADNIAFGLKQQRMPRAEREARIAEMERLFRLDGMLKRYPSELSGGQQQRVALARMLAVNPTLLLLDEPLSNLDAALRLEMRTELKRLHHTLGCTIVFVTHDQFEAMSLATSIVVMNEGRVVQMAPPLEIYHRPADRFVAKFVGNPPMNMMTADEHPAAAAWATSASDAADGAPTIGIRPEAISIHAEHAPGRVAATLDSVQPTGAECTSSVTLEGSTFFALSQQVPAAAEGERVWLGLSPAGVHGFDAEGASLTESRHA
jgi:iron(III) transport system ATP-binding protein